MNKVNLNNVSTIIKEKYLKENKISGISYLISYLSLSLIVLMILFLMGFLNPSNDVAPILLFIFLVSTVISFIIGIIYHKKKNTTRGNLDFFTEQDQLKYLGKFLKIQIAQISILFIGLFLLILGFIIKYKEGIITSFFGLTLITIAISYAIINKIKKNPLRSKKSDILEDKISEFSFFNTLSILERFILSILLIAIIVMSFSAITDSTNTVLNVFLLIIGLIFISYNIYISIKSKVKYDKITKR